VGNINTAHLAAMNAADSTQAQDAKLLATNLKYLLLQSDDPYIKKAVKAAGTKALKQEPESYIDALGVIFNAAQITRLSGLMHGLSDVPFTYEFVEKFYYTSMFNIGCYAFPAKNYKRGAHTGLLSDVHQTQFTADALKAYVKNEGLKINVETQSFNDWLMALRPTSMNRYEGSGGREKQFEDMLRPTFERNGFSIQEQTLRGEEFYKHCQIVKNLAEGRDVYQVKPEAIETLKAFAQGLTLDAPRLLAYFEAHGEAQGEKQADLLSETKGQISAHQATLTAAGSGLSSLLMGYTTQTKHIEAQTEQLMNFKEMIENGRYINVLDGGGYDHLAISSGIEHTALDYIYLSQKCLENEADGVDEPDVITQRDQKKAQLEAHYQKADMINQAIAFLKAPRIAAFEDAAASKFFYDTCALMDNALHLAQSCARQIEQKFYCALKASGKYGEANLMAAFIAAAESKESINVTIAQQDPEQENGTVPAIEVIERPMDEKINALLKADLMMHGWDGETPEVWAAKNMPDSGVLTHYENHSYTWFSGLYQSPSPLCASEGFVEKDLAHRMDCIKNIGQYLTKAKPYVDRATQAHIEDTLALIGGQLWPKLAELQEQCGFAGYAENDNAPAQAAAKTNRGYMPHTGG
tara:strand:- start:47476 stop:49389 length:1914 start_codon:yes stop_codon:yes gene_type:complete